MKIWEVVLVMATQWAFTLLMVIILVDQGKLNFTFSHEFSSNTWHKFTFLSHHVLGHREFPCHHFVRLLGFP